MSQKVKFVEFYRNVMKHLFSAIQTKQLCQNSLAKLTDILTQEKKEHLYDASQTLRKLKQVQHQIFEKLVVPNKAELVFDADMEFSLKDIVELSV